MLRYSQSSRPRETPTAEDLALGARVFEKNMRFVREAAQIALQMHTKDLDTHNRLAACFGGASYYIPSQRTYRWRILKDQMTSFLQQIRPLLSPTGLQRIQVLEETQKKEAELALTKKQSTELRSLRTHLTNELLKEAQRKEKELQKWHQVAQPNDRPASS